jgi:hypothetical protein
MGKLKGTTTTLQQQLNELRNLVVRKVGGGPGAPASTPVQVKQQAVSPLTMCFGNPPPTNELDALR